jgi:hypothetical protein
MAMVIGNHLIIMLIDIDLSFSSRFIRNVALFSCVFVFVEDFLCVMLDLKSFFRKKC